MKLKLCQNINNHRQNPPIPLSIATVYVSQNNAMYMYEKQAIKSLKLRVHKLSATEFLT